MGADPCSFVPDPGFLKYPDSDPDPYPDPALALGDQKVKIKAQLQNKIKIMLIDNCYKFIFRPA
jgi:hypothetical protein